MGSNMSTRKKIAILGFIAAAAASPIDLFARSDNAVAATSYQAFRGDGSVAKGWPSKDQWIPSFDQMWDINWPGILAHNPGHAVEAAQIKPAISQAAAETGVDARFILAIMMQESNGFLRVGTTEYVASGPNPGLMQSHGGPNCPTSQPCGYDAILAMIMQGVRYGGEEMNLEHLLQKSGRPEPANYFWAARYYNSGAYSMTPDCNDNLSCPASRATVTYTSDVANRLRGLTDATGARAGGNPALFQGEAC